MKGHIRKRGKNSWAIVIDTTGPDNKRKRKWISVKGTKKDAQLRCAALITEMQGGSIFEPAKATLDEYLQRWLDHMAGQVSAQSHTTYSMVVACSMDARTESTAAAPKAMPSLCNTGAGTERDWLLRP